MKKYCFFMTEAPHWFDVALELKNEGLAEPILWLGDDRHFDRAKNVFGENVVEMLTFVHRPYDLKNIQYLGENIGFLQSENYLRAKDKCFKMMDRLDLYGTFSRIDREVYFHQIIIWTLKKFSKDVPDFLLMAEAPHSHAQYLIYEICLFLKIPTYKFNRWTLAPLLFLQDAETNKILKKERPIKSFLNQKMKKIILDYVDDVYTKKDKYEISYMRIHKQKHKFPNNIKRVFKEDLPEIFFDIKHNIANKIKGRWTSINAYELSFFTRLKIQKIRAKNLRNQHKKNVENHINSKPYVYFALHYEHERSTNPDGGDFHDQFKAIQCLRKMLPETIGIVVKEHPSQFLVKGRGSRGRSPLFYNLIKNTKGLSIVDVNENSVRLIQDSLFISTISGTVALEASILGKKSITFGSTWFPNCPNTFEWNENLNYHDIIEKKVNSLEMVKNYLINHQRDYAVVGCQNGSVMRRFSDLINSEFKQEEKDGVKALIQLLIKSYG